MPPVAEATILGGRPAAAWAGFTAMAVGMFMAILDIQIVSASISDIQAGLAASPDEASWVQTSYLIAEIVMIPLSGFLSRMLSTRVLFTISAAGFTAASALAAIIPMAKTSEKSLFICLLLCGRNRPAPASNITQPAPARGGLKIKLDT